MADRRPVSRLGAVRVRTIELRILGVAVAALWLAAFGLVLLGYRPGGPVDILVGIAAIGPVLVAGAAILWPPVARGDRAFAGIAWLALASMLLLVPSLAGLVTQLTGRGPQTLLPSLEAAYPWLLALAATGLFAGLGVARRRLGGASLRRRAARAGVRHRRGAGPRDRGCVRDRRHRQRAGARRAARHRVALRAHGSRRWSHPPASTRSTPAPPPAWSCAWTARSTAGTRARWCSQGIRDGADVAWTGFAATRLTLGQQGLVRLGERVWVLSPGRSWTAADAERGAGYDIDRQVVAVALAPGRRPTPRRTAGWPSSTARARATAGSRSTG